MGQQQLLLLVLGAIIVGLAIVVGINLFGQGAVKANEDAVRQDILSMMARAEEFYRKPAMLGGGGKDFTNLTGFTDLGYKYNVDGTAVSGTYTNDNGTFYFAAGSDATTGPTITGSLAEAPEILVAYQITIDSNNQSTISTTDGSTTG